jgi:hypothetical protein
MPTFTVKQRMEHAMTIGAISPGFLNFQAAANANRTCAHDPSFERARRLEVALRLDRTRCGRTSS